MQQPLPLCCVPPAFELFSQQAGAIETTRGLIRAAVAVAMQQHDEIDPKNVERKLRGYGKFIASRVRGTQQQAVLAHLHQYLFDEQDFSGNADDYYNPANSYLPEVLESKRGLPITLALIYKAVAEQLNLNVHGVGLPGHFIAAVDTEQGRMYVDCFAGGRLLGREECRARVEAIFGDTVNWRDDMLEPATHRMWLSRMLQNLLHIFTTQQRWSDVGAMLEMQMLLWPGQAQLKRDLALVLARIDMPKPASIWLGDYLRSNPNDPERDELTDLLAKLSK